MTALDPLKQVFGEGYGWILLEAVIISIHIWVTGMTIMSVRKRFFNKDFYRNKFPQYKSLSHVMRPDSGYPDEGQGRLANLLTEEEWFIFNNYRRAHVNYLEGGFSVLVPLLIAGLYFTKIAFLSGMMYIIGREIFSQGYRRSGSKGRLVGVLILDISLIVLWLTAVYTCIQWGGGFSGLVKLLSY